MSDVTFINAYNEIVFENFQAILKQNLVFQTQLKLMESKIVRIEALEKQLADSTESAKNAEQLQARIDALTTEVTAKNSQIQQQSGADAERHRIQTALNDRMRECESLRASVEVLNRELRETTDREKRSSVDQRELHSLRERVDQAEQTAAEKVRYSQQLEALLPNSKRKKLGLPSITDTPVETPLVTDTPETVDLMPVQSSGGMF